MGAPILNSRSISRVLGATSGALILISIGVQSAAYLAGEDLDKLVRLFSVNMERNIPTAFSVLLLLCASLLLSGITVLKKSEKDPDASYWAILFFGFFAMAGDEALSFHEMLNGPMRSVLGADGLGVFHFAWVIPGITIVSMLAPIFTKFLSSLPRKTRFRFLISGAIYLGGAIGFELVGGHYAEVHQRDFIYSMITTVEEGLEMAGIILFIRALMIYIAENYKEVRFRFE